MNMKLICVGERFMSSSHLSDAHSSRDGQTLSAEPEMHSFEEGEAMFTGAMSHHEDVCDCCVTLYLANTHQIWVLFTLEMLRTIVGVTYL